MPHIRSRYLDKQIRKDLTWSRVVSLLGMRQAGKTTLLKLIAKRYLTLDDPETVASFAKGDWSVIDQPASYPIAFDEAQLSPALFQQIKMRADDLGRPGLYLLTGSVRFLSRKEIRESLTGRTSLLELLPLTLAESHNRPLRDLIGVALRQSPKELIRTLSKEEWCKNSHLDHYLDCGGMPGVCFKRDKGIRSRAWSAHLDSVLGRDIQLIRATQVSLSSLRELYFALSRQQGEPLNVSALARMIGVSAPTLKQLLSSFESLFLIRKHGDTVYCEDQGLATFAAGGRGAVSAKTNLLRLVFSELHAQLRYLHDPRGTLAEFKTRGGAYVPWIVDVPELGRLAITADASPRVSDKSLQSLTAFRKRRPDVRVLAIHQGREGYLSAKNAVPCIPVNWIF
jgi:predicted AAA+ superfamily ATPase